MSENVALNAELLPAELLPDLTIPLEPWRRGGDLCPPEPPWDPGVPLVVTPPRWPYVVPDGIDPAVETPSLLPTPGQPVVTDPSAAAFPDSGIPDALWYPPGFELVAPEPTTAAAGSPFLFSFRTAGHDAQNRPGIEATVTVTARMTIPEPAADGSWLLPTEGLAFTLQIPYRDTDGRPATLPVPTASVTIEGNTHTLTFAVRDGFARAAYGALSTPDYQEQPVRLVATWSFVGLVAVPGMPAAAATVSIPVPRQVAMDVLLPCQDFGGLYLEQTATGPKAVGCADALALGTLPDRMYAELPELATARYRVFWSLGVPGTYLLLPARYGVARDPARLTETGVRPPQIAWTQQFDATGDDDLPCVLTATLAPDLLPADLSAVTRALTGRSPNPRIVLPTTPGSGLGGLDTQWALAVADTPRQVIDGDLLRVVLRVSTADAALLQGQLAGGADPAVGNATITLSDHSTLGPVTLRLAVDDLAGPWPGGPVDTVLGPDTVTLTNRAGGDAVLTGLRLTTDTGGASVVTQGFPRTITPGAASTAAVPAGTVAAAAEYTLGPAAPATIAAHRIYLDDLHTMAVLVNDARMGAAGLASVEVTARLGADAATVSVTLTPSLPQYELDIVTPLVADRQAADALLTLTATAHRADGGTVAHPPVTVDLHRGAIVALSRLLA